MNRTEISHKNIGVELGMIAEGGNRDWHAGFEAMPRCQQPPAALLAEYLHQVSGLSEEVEMIMGNIGKNPQVVPLELMELLLRCQDYVDYLLSLMEEGKALDGASRDHGARLVEMLRLSKVSMSIDGALRSLMPHKFR